MWLLWVLGVWFGWWGCGFFVEWGWFGFGIVVMVLGCGGLCFFFLCLGSVVVGFVVCILGWVGGWLLFGFGCRVCEGWCIIS